MEIESGGVQNMGCIDKNLRNYEQRLREEHKEVDAETLLEFFLWKKKKILHFILTMSLMEQTG